MKRVLILVGIFLFMTLFWIGSFNDKDYTKSGDFVCKFPGENDTFKDLSK